MGKLALEPTNLLLIDEPTNHLDLPAQEVLEAALLAYPGAMVLVSHDRALIDAVATETWAIEGEGKVRRVIGGYTALLADRRRDPRPGGGSDEELEVSAVVASREGSRARAADPNGVAGRGRRRPGEHGRATHSSARPGPGIRTGRQTLTWSRRLQNACTTACAACPGSCRAIRSALRRPVVGWTIPLADSWPTGQCVALRACRALTVDERGDHHLLRRHPERRRCARARQAVEPGCQEAARSRTSATRPSSTPAARRSPVTTPNAVSSRVPLAWALRSSWRPRRRPPRCPQLPVRWPSRPRCPATRLERS